jgi:hypothetical protein
MGRSFWVISCCMAAVFLLPIAWATGSGRLKVSANHRYLEYEDGRPFFYLGDTAWELYHRLNREEATQYLTNRSQKGFTVIQATLLTQFGAEASPNAYGDFPFLDGDPTKPNEAYFKHVDLIVNKAKELGLFMGILPSWGTYWAVGRVPYKAPGTFVFTPATARQYGYFLGKRYKDAPFIWILGGDRSITNDQERAIVEALATGLKEGDGGAHLMTFHPVGPGLSSIKLNDAKWLDFNMSQSSHAARDLDTGLYVEHDYALKPEKPTLDGEGPYEGIPVAFYLRGSTGIDRFDDFDVRQAAYWAVLAGACGYVYGNNNIWQMYKPQPTRKGSISAGAPPGAADPFVGQPGGIIGANIPWYEAMDHPGAFQMRDLRRLFESVPFTKLVPDQHIVLDGPATGGAKIRAAKSSDGSFAIVYSPYGESFTLDKSIVKGEQLREFWYDPRYGISYVIDEPDAWGIQRYKPPSSGRGHDWVLVIEDKAAVYPLPGAATQLPVGGDIKR